jgi:hypothetical protein
MGKTRACISDAGVVSPQTHQIDPQGHNSGQRAVCEVKACFNVGRGGIGNEVGDDDREPIEVKRTPFSSRFRFFTGQGL